MLFDYRTNYRTKVSNKDCNPEKNLIKLDHFSCLKNVIKHSLMQLPHTKTAGSIQMAIFGFRKPQQRVLPLSKPVHTVGAGRSCGSPLAKIGSKKVRSAPQLLVGLAEAETNQVRWRISSRVERANLPHSHTCKGRIFNSFQRNERNETIAKHVPTIEIDLLRSTVRQTDNGDQYCT